MKLLDAILEQVQERTAEALRTGMSVEVISTCLEGVNDVNKTQLLLQAELDAFLEEERHAERTILTNDPMPSTQAYHTVISDPRKPRALIDHELPR